MYLKIDFLETEIDIQDQKENINNGVRRWCDVTGDRASPPATSSRDFFQEFDD